MLNLRRLQDKKIGGVGLHDPHPLFCELSEIRKSKDDEEAISMTADGNYRGHHEEKDVPYRRQMGSDQDDSEPEAGEEGFEEEEDEDPLAGKPKFERLRDMLVHLMSKYEEEELEQIKLDHDFVSGTTYVHFQAKQPKE